MQEYQIAYLMSLQVVSFFGSVFWSNMADRWKKPRVLLQIAAAGYAISFACLALPVFPGEGNEMYRFIYSASVMSTTWFCISAFFPLIDGCIMTMLSRDPNFTKDHYNHQRLFGIPAHILAIVLSGWTFKNFGSLGFQCLVVSCTLCFGVAVTFCVPDYLEDAPVKKHHSHHAVEMKDQAVVDSPTFTLLRNFGFVFFLLFGLSAGMLRAALSNFQTFFVEKNYKSDPFISSLSSVSRVASEIAVFFYAKKMSNAIGIYWLLLLSQVAGLVRIFGYAFGPEDPKWWILPFVLEIFKGLNSGLIVTSSVRIASDIAPPGCASSAQGLFAGTYQGLSMFVGGIFSGTLLYYNGNDLKSLFKWTGSISLVFMTIFAFKFAFIDRVIKLPCMKGKK